MPNFTYYQAGGNWRAARRAGAEAQVSLALRRAWYSSDGLDPESPKGDAPKSTGNGGTPPPPEMGRIEDLPSWAQDEIKKLRNESAQRRVKLNELEEQERSFARREQARLAEEGKFKELAESRAAELAKLQPYQQRAEALETMIRESNTRRIEQVREDMRTLIPTDYPPEKLSGWLDANWTRLMPRQAPETDAGAGGAGGSGKSVTLTAEEKAMAAKTGMTEEQYIKAKEKAGRK